jgi:hypothetical protein
MSSGVLAAAVVAILAVVGVVAWAVMRPVAMQGERQPFGPGASWMLVVGAVPGDERAVTVSVSAKDANGRPISAPAPPIAMLRMIDMPTLPERLPLVEEAPGSWRGAMRLSSPGRWNLEIELDGETVSLPFEAGSQ